MSWLLYMLGTAAIAALSATAAERSLRAAGRPARLVWVVASLLSVALPVAALAGWTGVRRQPAAGGVIRIMEVSPAAGPSAWTVLLACWVLLSLTAFGLILVRVRRVRRLASALPRATVGGVRVLVSADVGPATLGVVRPTIVVPRWLFEMDTRSRRMAILHEQEHRRVGDVALLNAMAVLVALVPWHPVLWWQAARLHRAIELDCDERVVRRVRDRPGYGRMLVEAASRQIRSVPLAAGLGLHTPLLERRIRTLISRPYRRGMRTVASLAAALLAIACALPTPYEPGRRAGGEARSTYRLVEQAGDSLREVTVGAVRPQAADSATATLRFTEIPSGGVLRRADPDDPRIRPR